MRVENGKLADPHVIIECRGDHRSSATSVVAAHPSVTDTRKSYQTRRGDLRSPATSVTAARSSMAARRFMKHELWLQKSVALD